MASAVDSLLDTWFRDAQTRECIVHHELFPARKASVVPFPDDLPGILQHILLRNKIAALYSHQAEAWNTIRSGHHTVILSGTSSGKTLCYNLPVFAEILEHSKSRALYIFPTKALAQDQMKGLSSWLADLPPSSSFSAGIYDGDTTQVARPEIRRNSRIVLTNPDMLHTGILPHHTNWIEFFRNLKYVVIDEMHVYRGVFGSHFANLMRRLDRLARFYGAQPIYILTSATIANPYDHAQRLVGGTVQTIATDGSPAGSKHFLLYNPPLINKQLGIRAPLLPECARLVFDLQRARLQTLQFVVTRRAVELMLMYLGGGGPGSRIQGYRSGYLPLQRRAIEKGLREKELDTVVSTNALELGIDIGSIDAAVISGYPGAIASVRQQMGRAGRQSSDSLAVMVASQDPIDQFLISHPSYLTDASPEMALIDPDNLVILLQHLKCALFELPFGRESSFGNLDPKVLQELLSYLTTNGEGVQRGEKTYWMADQYPAAEISLRTSSPSTVVLSQTDEEGRSSTVGIVDAESACWMVHPQAVYMHSGTPFLVESLDLENGQAQLVPFQGDYYTQPQSETTIELLDLTWEDMRQYSSRSLGDLKVTTQVTGFKKLRWFTNENLGEGNLAMPPSHLTTKGYWLALSEKAIASIKEVDFWRNDPNDYGPGWTRLRGLVRQRDQFTCQSCGRPESGTAHHVHHIRPFRTFESPEIANRLDNLITLCPTCHMNAEAGQYIRSGLAGLSYVFHHLSTLFLMCDINDLGVKTEASSELASGLPAVILYDHAQGGIGLAKNLYDIDLKVLNEAMSLVTSCACLDGCPSCVGPGGENGSGAKAHTAEILTAILKDLNG